MVLMSSASVKTLCHLLFFVVCTGGCCCFFKTARGFSEKGQAERTYILAVGVYWIASGWVERIAICPFPLMIKWDKRNA